MGPRGSVAHTFARNGEGVHDGSLHMFGAFHHNVVGARAVWPTQPDAVIAADLLFFSISGNMSSEDGYWNSYHPTHIDSSLAVRLN